MCFRPLAALVAVVALSAIVSGDTKADATPGILISRQLAADRQLHVGDIVRLSARPSGERAQSFRIDGIYEPVPDPMRFAQQHYEARFHLPNLIELIRGPVKAGEGAAPESISAINVALRNPSTAGEVAKDLAARLPGTIASPVNATDDRTSTFIVIERFHLAIAIVSVAGSAVFLLALMVMLVDERRETVGMLRLIGFTRHRILLQIVAEGALIAVAGTLFGILFALAAQAGFNRFFQWRYNTALVFLRVTPSVVAQSVALALPLGIAASLLSSWTFVRRGLLTLVRR
jgi:ABC-type lipoprotein release transport system permease subunit